MFQGRISVGQYVRDGKRRVGKVDFIDSSPVDGAPAAYIVGSNPRGGKFADWVELKALRRINTKAVSTASAALTA